MTPDPTVAAIVDDIQAIAREMSEQAARMVLISLVTAILADEPDCYATHDAPRQIQ